MIIHRDLSANNFLIGPDLEIKLCDFGFSTNISFTDEKKKSFCGLSNYMAPEKVMQDAHGSLADNWAYGVLLFYMLTG